MRYVYFFGLIMSTYLTSVSLEAAAINTTPLQTNGTQHIDTPLSSPVPNNQQVNKQDAINNDQQFQEAQINAWKIESAQVGRDYVLGLDQGQYGPSWSKGDQLFQQTISQKEWTVALQMARQRLGKVLSRTLKDQRPAFDPKGLPRGPYMVIEYNTSFERAQNSGELLTLRLGPDGKWRVLTYQVN